MFDKSKVLTSQMVKEMAKSYGADLCGIASMDRFEGAPKQNDPRYIFPGAKSMIVLGYRVARGTLRGIEEGTHFIDYASMGYAAINQVQGPMTLWKMAADIEDMGWEAVPIANINGGEAVSSLNGNFRENWSVPVEEGKPYPDVLIHFRYAAYLAGLGEIGWSGVFLTPEFGPRVRFNLIMTDAPLDPDPLVEPGTICDRCKQCVRNCGGAISETESVKVTLGGKQIEYALLDPIKCEYGLKNGCDNTANPFLVEYPHVYGYGRAVEGGRGCVRACMVHLEQRHKLQNEFHNPFRQKPLWKVDKDAPHPYPEHIIEDYVKTGKIESANAYIEYNEKENYGTSSEKVVAKQTD